LHGVKLRKSNVFYFLKPKQCVTYGEIKKANEGVKKANTENSKYAARARWNNQCKTPKET